MLLSRLVILCLLLIVAQIADAQMPTKYTVKKGRHFSFPRVIKFRINPKVVKWEVSFDDNSNYILKEPDGTVSVDQLDWNKLCGVFFNLFNTRSQTAMIGWRYNVETERIELAPYYHVNGGTDRFPPLMTLVRNELVIITLTIKRNPKMYVWTLEKKGGTGSHEFPFTHNKKLCSFINFYFGGNKRAPQTVSAHLKIDK